MKQIKSKSSKTEQVVDRLFKIMCKIDKLVGFFVLPAAFIFKYSNVFTASILVLFISLLLGLFYAIYKAIIHPNEPNVLSPDTKFKTNQKSKNKTPSTAGAIASNINP